MIRPHTYPLMAALILGVLESLVIGYNYFTVIMLTLFFTVALDILIFNLLETRAASELQISRSMLSDRLVRGGKTTVTVTLANSSMTTVHLEYQDAVCETLVTENNSGRVSVKGGGSAQFQYDISAPFCGRQHLGPFRAWMTDPFHLCRKKIELAALSHICVEVNPATFESTRREASRKMRNSESARRAVRGGQGYQFFRIRQYTEGDDLRGIVWSRYGEPPGDDIYVKEMQEERTREIVFLIDYSSGTVFGESTRRMYDDILSAVFRSAGEIAQAGDRVGFLFHSSEHHHFISAGNVKNTGASARNFVANSIPDGRFSLRSAITEARKKIGKSTAVIVISPMLNVEEFEQDFVHFLSGGSYSLILLKAGDYVSRRESDLGALLVRGIVREKDEETTRMGGFLSRYGLRTSVSSGNELRHNIMEAWAYGRMMNAGS